jgi:hypothetical protein
MKFIEWLKKGFTPERPKKSSFSGSYQGFPFNEKSCAGCSKKVPEMFLQGGFVSGIPFGKCPRCGKIWCYDCDSRHENGNLIYHECPKCYVTLSTWL